MYWMRLTVVSKEGNCHLWNCEMRLTVVSKEVNLSQTVKYVKLYEMRLTAILQMYQIKLIGSNEEVNYYLTVYQKRLTPLTNCIK